jgi:2-keto-4-pentenoate hydratase/2-oxohepta-3-ene-1,7-dioic acid hydratase in catechol pathway
MRFITFKADGGVLLGVLDGDEVAPLTGLPPGVTGLRELIGALGPQGLASFSAKRAAARPVDEVTLLPPVPDPSKIICVGVNYRAHRDEARHSEQRYPTIFTRFADTQMGHGAVAILPPVTERFDYEGELAVIIGKSARDVAAADARAYIAGLSVYNDFSVRDWQKHTTQWVPGKNFPGTGAFGPALVTLDEVPDIDALTLETRVNGEVRQHGYVSDLIFGIPALIEYITTFTPLAPGDVIVTGTPSGVGQFMDPPTFLAAGDEVEVEISGIGVLRNTIAEAPDAATEASLAETAGAL